jgi:hypothetical protein
MTVWLRSVIGVTAVTSGSISGDLVGRYGGKIITTRRFSFVFHNHSLILADGAEGIMGMVYIHSGRGMFGFMCILKS